MKIGLLGPSAWLSSVQEVDQWCEVMWGTDDVSHVKSRLRGPNVVDAVVIEGTVEFLTSEIVKNIAESGVRGFTLAPRSRETQWIDDVPGVYRIATFAELGERVRDNDQTVEAPIVQSMDITARDRGKAICVWGPCGAPGITTIAISLAILAAREGAKVVLCDADSRGASIAIGLGLIDDIPGFAAACRLAGRAELTDAECERLALRSPAFGENLSVLTGLPRASRWAEIAGPKARQVVDQLCASADLVVIDVGSGIEENEWIDGAPQRDGTARTLISNADAVVAVGLGDAVGISRLIRGLDELDDLCADPIVVLNRTTRQSAREASDALTRFTRHRVAATIPVDSREGLEDATSRAAHSAKGLWRAVQNHVGGLESGAKR